MPRIKRNPLAITLEESGKMVPLSKISAPGKLHVPEHLGGVVSFGGPQECGKTIRMIETIDRLLDGGWVQLFSDKWIYIEPGTYIPQRVFSNREIMIKGINYVANDTLQALMERAYGRHSSELGQWTRTIFAMFEADSIYTHLESTDKEISKKLLNLSQSMCYGNFFFYEFHEHLGVLAVIRQKREIICEPVYDHESDTINMDIYNGQTMEYYDKPLVGASYYHDKYKRHNGTI